MRFPEVSTILRKNGATYLTYPSAFAYSTGCAHWESLLRSRAIENQCYVIAPAQVGFHNEKRQSYGHAMVKIHFTFRFNKFDVNQIYICFIQVVDPWGKIIAECDKNDAEVPQCRIATIDLESLFKIRSRLPCFEHRRDNVYGLAGVRMIAPDKSIDASSAFKPVPIEDEATPYFVFGKNPVPKSTTFFETPLSIAFTNITCVVPGRKLNLPFYYCRINFLWKNSEIV